MKIIFALSLVIMSTLAAPEGAYYDSKYDHFDVNALIENPRLMKSYANCFLGKGSCTPDGTTFKKWLPEALETGCERCSTKQKQLVRKVIKAFSKQLPQEFEEMRKIYDPAGKYADGVKSFLDESD